jgi:hypothetical protein
MSVKESQTEHSTISIPKLLSGYAGAAILIALACLFPEDINDVWGKS